MKLDLNCDLGEGEAPARTRALMRWITSANIACGGHAGDARSMRTCVRLAKQSGVNIGAHPGPWNRADKGRNSVTISPDELELLLLQQVSALEQIASSEGVRLHHIKLHGALYHAAERDAKLARRYVRVVARHWPKAIVYGFTRGHVLPAVAQAGLRGFAEGFADRAYRADGRLVSRAETGAVLGDVRTAVTRVRDLLAGRGLMSMTGRRLPVRIDTLCVHSDSPHALPLVRVLARLL